MSIITSSKVVIGHKSTTRFHLKPAVSNLGISSFKTRFEGNKPREQFGSKMKRRSLTVYANTVSAAPLPSTPPPSGSIKSWIIGLVVSLILPFFSHKWGPLWVLEKRIVNAVQAVEDIVEVVEKVAEEVERISDDISDDLPEGKVKEMVDFVENMAEKTAKTADSVDDLIDKVQETEEKVKCVVESIDKEVKSSPKQATEDN
ncbi:uncharacterized protein LOC142525511 [Primulina tabacum]|uniref:uncharacterized protein LOC142525511 n=1 Tax=Primulina tabacum TaxID=48773 RepID=UPI003F59D3F2